MGGTGVPRGQRRVRHSGWEGSGDDQAVGAGRHDGGGEEHGRDGNRESGGEQAGAKVVGVGHF